MAKTISLVILIATCVTLVSSSQYFPFKKYGKPPSKLVCPIPTGPGVCAELCLSDADCQNEQKCCSNGCGHQCTDPVSGGHKPIRKPRNNNWICPPATGPGICISLCSGDNSCPGRQKCCSNGCGQVCTNPIKGPGRY